MPVNVLHLVPYGPQAYLRDLPERIASHPINRFSELAPWNLRAAPNGAASSRLASLWFDRHRPVRVGAPLAYGWSGKICLPGHGPGATTTVQSSTRRAECLRTLLVPSRRVHLHARSAENQPATTPASPFKRDRDPRAAARCCFGQGCNTCPPGISRDLAW